MNTEQTTKIATLNDAYRRGTKFTVTRGVQEVIDFLGLIQAVRDYANFNEDNDPYGEHDFGKLEWYEQTIYWKIDYYDQMLETWHSPLSPDCNRVLTIMLAEEY